MPIDRLKRRFLSPQYLEGLVLLAVAPWLLFPSQFPLITLFALIAVAVLWLWPWLRRKNPFPYTPFNGSILLFEIAILVGIIVTADPVDTLPKTTGVILGLTTWRFIAQTVRDRSMLHALVVLFFLVGFAFIIFGALGTEWLVKIPFLEPILSYVPSRLITPPESPVGGVHVNQLAGVLAFYFPFVLSLLVGWRRGRSQSVIFIVMLFAAATIGLLLILTQSRSAWMGGVIGSTAVLLMWTLVLRPSKKRIAIQFSLVVLIFLCIILVLSVGPDRLKQIWDEPAQTTALGSFGTANFRIEVWQWAISAIQDFPFTGTGLGSFRRVAFRLYPINIDPNFDLGHAHNIFLQTTLDIGIPGLIAYMSILIVSFIIGWRAAKKSPEMRSLSIGLLASLIALHVFGMTDAQALGQKPGLVFWMALGLLVAIDRIAHFEGITQVDSDKVLDTSESGVSLD